MELAVIFTPVILGTGVEFSSGHAIIAIGILVERLVGLGGLLCLHHLHEPGLLLHLLLLHLLHEKLHLLGLRKLRQVDLGIVHHTWIWVITTYS